MPRPTGSTAQERILLRANAIGKVKEPEENTARSRILSRAAEMGEVKPAEAAPKYAEETTREPYSIAALGAGNYGADKRIFGEGYNYGQGLAKAGQIGLTQIAKAGSSVGAWAENMLGAFIKEGSNGVVAPDTSKWLFNRWNQAIDAEAEGVRQKYAENTARGGRAAEVAEDLGAATVAALPQAVAAMLTGGASSVMTAEQLAARAAASPGIVNTISTGMRTMAKDPNFQLSFAQVFGPGYEQAKADGADDFRATVYAAGNGLMNAAVEVGGGIQTLPKELQGGTSAWKAWVDSMLEEGKEEVVQGVIERAMQNAVYDKSNPLVGIGNDAIFDPAAAAEEFAGGAVVGGILSGGQIGVNALGNRVAYDAAKAQYNRDVQRNTAPEINTKAAEAVEAVTRGEAITGNQAAAIARDPVAVEVLEQRTGVKLDTDKPISQVKRDIAGLASRKVTQETQRATPPSPAAQKRAEKRVGGFLENGQKAYQEMSRTAEDAPSLYAGFSSVYNAGLNGIEADKAKGKYAAMLTPEQRYAAYNAGLEDARVQLARENAEVASVTTTAGAGLADNEYSRGLIAVKKDTAATLNAWGKKLGVRIEIVDQVLGGRANGQYIKEQNLIQIAADSDKPLLNVTAHEITHRMQDLSPAEYRKFRQAAMEYKMQENGADTEAEIVEKYMEAAEQEGVTLTRDGVLDELAADFAGDMLDNAALFAKFSKENRTAAQKLLDSLKEFLNKVKIAFTGKYRDVAAQEAYGKDFAELEDIAKQWQAAFDAAERQAEISSSVRPGDTVQFDDVVYSLRVTDKDTLDFLDKQKTITTYKTMQFVDGKLYPPMAARVDGRYEDASELGKWEMAIERPDLVKDGKFKLDKGKGQGSLMAAYNPYMHSSNLVLNDQFSGAYTRDNLVTVECEVPVSEMTSGYHADGAKDSVGWHSWHTGTVAGQVRKATGVERQVFLSRWIKPVRILPNAEVAGMYKELLGNTGIAVPDNVVTPGLLAELKKAGVPIKESGRVKTAAGEGDGVRYSLKNTTDKNVVSIKQQIANAVQELNAADPVVRKTVFNIFSSMNIKQKRAWAEAEALKYGNRVDRQGYGSIEVSRKDVNSALNYLQSDGEIAAFTALPHVLKRGKEIYREADHKGRGYSTVTFAGPVEINGTRGNMAVVVRETSKNHYDMHRIVMPDGSAFTFSEKTNAETGPTAATSSKEALTQPTASTSKTSILTDGENVKPQFSLKAYSEAEKKDHVKSAKEFFGKTYSWNETGYIATDGTKLDFSGRHDGGPGGYRAVDHRDIRDALGLDYGGDDYSGAMVQFMGEGNIRISPESGGINLSVMPTKAQFDSLADFISKNRGEVILDLDDANGNTVSSTEYPRGTHSSKVINDIKAYFENGTTPQVSELGKFRYQLKNTAEVEREARELKKERNALAKQNEALKQRVQELKGEMRISKEPSVVARDVKKLGLNLILEYGSDVKYADVQSEMDALAKAVMKRDVTMEGLMPHAKAVAEAIVDNTSELTEYGAELLEIRDHLKRQTIQFNGDMANYGDFRKSHMGTLKLNKDNGTSVDTVYGELTEMFGEGYFPSDVYTEADKLLQIGDVLDGLDSIYHNPFEGYRDAAVQEIANQLLDGMISDQVRQKKTYADRRALEKQEAVGRVREMLSRERQKRRDDVNALRKTYNEKTKKGNEKRKATAMRARIARHTGAISRKLVNPTDKQHIPERLRVTVASLLQNINLESAYSYDENGRLRKNADGDPTRRTLEADRLKQIYDDILDNEGNMVVDPALTESGGLLDSLSALGGKRIADMNVSELETVWNAIRAIETTLTTYDKTLSSAKYKSTSEWAERFAADSMGRKRRNRKISLDMADPYTFFSAYGDAGKQLYRTLRNAQDQQHWMLRDVQREAEKFLDKDVYKNRFDRHTFTTGRGVELTLTTDQIMNLYNLARRGEQAMHHLTVGGIVQPEIQRNGKLKAIPRGNDNILLTEEDIRAITAVLTPEQVKVANGLQKLASTKLAEWGNNASMQVYGYRKFKEEHYWPIKAAKDAVASSVEKDADNARSIKNMGSAKALTPNAGNALDIGGAYDVFAQNASDMIKYATLLAPMEDINRLYNYRYRDSSGNLTGRNMRQVLSGVYGDAAQKYWRNLMRDMQNGMVKNSSDTTRSIERIVGNTKGAAVGSNWRVVIQQPTAFFRAAVILDPENMAKGIAKGVTDGNGWDKARNWAAIAGIKDSSGFDQGSRYTIAREVYGSSDSVMDKLSDWSSRAAANADAITWGKIWNACEWQVAADTKTEVGSDAYYRQVAELFTDVIDQTQVVDGIMQRTQIMRDSDALTRQATSFMGEPLKSLNILMRSYDAWRFETNTQKRSAALKQLKRSVGALLVTDIINSLAQSLVDALRDDDKEKKYWARFFAALTGVSGDEESFGELAKNVLLEGNLKGNITLVGRLPYAKDLISILQGYSVERMDADAIGDIVRATQTMYSSVTGEGKYTTAYACKQLLTAVSKIFGVSVANLGRDVWAAARSAANETGNVRIMFEMEKAIYRMDRSAGNRKRWCELLYLAQKESDTKTARMIYKEMLEHGYDEKDVQQGVETIMKAEQNVKSVKELKNRWRAP
nr:MAG TPA: Large polyvalent protein-associated domain 3 [Caudoviricetes sp.]